MGTVDLPVMYNTAQHEYRSPKQSTALLSDPHTIVYAGIMEKYSASHFPEEPGSRDSPDYGGMCNSWWLWLGVGSWTRSDVLIARGDYRFHKRIQSAPYTYQRRSNDCGNHGAHESIPVRHLRGIAKEQPSFGNHPPDSSLAEKFFL